VRCPAYEWHRESFFHQDRANVATVGFQRSAIFAISCGQVILISYMSPVLALLRRRERPGAITESSRCFGSKLAFRLAGGASRLRRIEADKANVRLLVINPYRIPIDDANV
jgi:hypothetical protein